MEAEEGGTGAKVGVTDSAGEVLAAMGLAVMVLVHPGRVSPGAVLVRDSAGRVDLRVEVFLAGRTAVESGIAVSVGEIAAFAIVGFTISKGTLLILASMALDIRISTNTTTPFTPRTRITTTMAIQASTNPESTEDRTLAT
jgi:hypothetical protein